MRWHEDEMGTGSFECGKPGRYLVEVKEVKEKKTGNGDNMWSVAFKDVEAGTVIAWDNLVFGQSKGIALKKLSMLGVPRDNNGFFEIQSKDELIGMRCHLNLIKSTYKDKNNIDREKLEPDFYSDGFGYELAAVPF